MTSGKVAVSREILAKRAPLTPDERVEMQCHPGAARLSSSRSRMRRPPFTTERALKEVDRCAGSQFAPKVAAASLEIWSGGVLGDLPAAAAF